MEGVVSWAGRRVFVTGGNGFLGSHVVGRIAGAGAAVACLIKEDLPRSIFSLAGTDRLVSIVPGALDDPSFLRTAILDHKADAVIHLAAQPIVGDAVADPLPSLESNIRGTYHLLEAVRLARGVRSVVVMSSDKAYGDGARLPYAEADALLGATPYDASKACADILARCYARTYGLPVGVARCGNLYGPGDLQWSRVVPGTIRSLIVGDRPVIRSDGTMLRDYLYVEDAAEAVLALGLALDRQDVRGEAFNFGTGIPTSVISVVRDLIGRSGISLDPIVQGGAKGEIQAQILDSSKARRVLGWEARTPLAAGLDLAWDWYGRWFRDHGAA